MPSFRVIDVASVGNAGPGTRVCYDASCSYDEDSQKLVPCVTFYVGPIELDALVGRGALLGALSLRGDGGRGLVVAGPNIGPATG